TFADQYDDINGYYLRPEMLDPANLGSGWTWLNAPMAIYRKYHSTASLLPDGRILVAGGYINTANGFPPSSDLRWSGQIYTPPNLVGIQPGDRPAITSTYPSQNLAPSQTGTLSFIITTDNSYPITKATLVRLAAATHGF